MVKPLKCDCGRKLIHENSESVLWLCPAFLEPMKHAGEIHILIPQPAPDKVIITNWVSDLLGEDDPVFRDAEIELDCDYEKEFAKCYICGSDKFDQRHENGIPYMVCSNCKSRFQYIEKEQEE